LTYIGFSWLSSLFAGDPARNYISIDKNLAHQAEVYKTVTNRRLTDEVGYRPTAFLSNFLAVSAVEFPIPLGGSLRFAERSG
jgi:hypothetical protein